MSKFLATALVGLLVLGLVADVAADSCYQACYRDKSPNFCKKAALAKRSLLKKWTAETKTKVDVRVAGCDVVDPKTNQKCNFRIIYAFPNDAARKSFHAHEVKQSEFGKVLKGKGTTGNQGRAALIKRRVPPRKLRRKKTFDQPRRLHVRPDDPTFEGRIASELTSVYGPRKLLKILEDFGPHLTASHLATAISLLAGMATGRQLPAADLEATYREPARTCAELLRARVDSATPVDVARAAYALARLQVDDPPLMVLLMQVSEPRLDSYPPEALCGLLAGLAALGERPTPEWLRRFSVASFSVMSALNAQDLANCLYAFAQLGASPSDVWAERALQLFRGRWGQPTCHAPSVVKFGMAAARLRLRPGTNWMGAYLKEARRLVDRMTPPELASMLWVLVQLRHSPDLLYVEAWTKSAATRIRTFNAASLSLAVHALGSLAAARKLPDTPGALPGRFVAVLLERSGEVLGELSPEEHVNVLWGLVSLRLRPPNAWLDAWLAATQPQLRGLPWRALGDALWALGRLQHDPGARWLAEVEAAADAQLTEPNAQALALLIWGLTRLDRRPKREWLLAFRRAALEQYGPDATGELSQLIARAVAGQLQADRQRRPPSDEAASALPLEGQAGAPGQQQRGRRRRTPQPLI